MLPQRTRRNRCGHLGLLYLPWHNIGCPTWLGNFDYTRGEQALHVLLDYATLHCVSCWTTLHSGFLKKPESKTPRRHVLDSASIASSRGRTFLVLLFYNPTTPCSTLLPPAHLPIIHLEVFCRVLARPFVGASARRITLGRSIRRLGAILRQPPQTRTGLGVSYIRMSGSECEGMVSAAQSQDQGLRWAGLGPAGMALVGARLASSERYQNEPKADEAGKFTIRRLNSRQVTKRGIYGLVWPSYSAVQGRQRGTRTLPAKDRASPR